MKKIKDLEMLLVACRRSKKLREEGRAAFSLAVLHDNLHDGAESHLKAIKYYTQFLKVRSVSICPGSVPSGVYQIPFGPATNHRSAGTARTTRVRRWRTTAWASATR